MFILKNGKGVTALMKSGSPFVYSSRDTARLGAKVLNASHGNLSIERVA